MGIVSLAKQEARARFLEVGSTGLKHASGILDEEFLRELRGIQGVKVYREMSRNDAVIGASLFAYITLAREVTFRVDSAHQGDRDADEVAEFVKGALFEDMNLSWRDLLGEVFSFLTYGWCLTEKVFKRRGGDVRDPTKRSKFTDNRIGWRKWAPRAQDTLYQWEIDDAGGTNAMIQRAPPHFTQAVIPIEKALLFRTLVERNSPEGISILRTAYLSWYQKRRISIIRGIGVERDLAGMPVLTPPEGVDLWNPNDPSAVSQKANAEKVVRNIRRNEHEGIIKPFGWTLELLSSGGSRQFDINQVIAQLNTEIAMSMMTDFLLVGHEKVGARSMREDARDTFSHAASGFLDSICDVINRFAIPELVEINGWDRELTPKLAHGPVAEIGLSELVNFIEKTAGVGLLFPDENLEKHLRERAQLPPPPERGEQPRVPDEPPDDEQPDEERPNDDENEEGTDLEPQPRARA